jgi:hypothetical protein
MRRTLAENGLRGMLEERAARAGGGFGTGCFERGRRRTGIFRGKAGPALANFIRHCIVVRHGRLAGQGVAVQRSNEFGRERVAPAARLAMANYQERKKGDEVKNPASAGWRQPGVPIM